MINANPFFIFASILWTSITFRAASFSKIFTFTIALSIFYFTRFTLTMTTTSFFAFVFSIKIFYTWSTFGLVYACITIRGAFFTFIIFAFIISIYTFATCSIFPLAFSFLTCYITIFSTLFSPKTNFTSSAWTIFLSTTQFIFTIIWAF